MLNGVQKNRVLEFFGELSKIPRGSGNEKGVSDYLLNWAKERNLEVTQDKALNVLIRKPASKGYENAPGIILQGHMDMVCEKNKGTTHDFLKDPITLVYDKDGDMVYGKDTTLGADNGLGVAFSMAILDDKNLAHPNIEALFTVEEETTMRGAFEVDGSLLKNRILLNLDSEEEGEFLVSSAGGTRCALKYVFENSSAKGLEAYKLVVGGLKGGHSGADIHKGRGNAIKLAARVLSEMSTAKGLRLVDINAGMKSNAIPREADVVFVVNPGQKALLEDVAKKMEEAYKNEFFTSDPGVQITLEAMECPAEAMTDKCSAALIRLLLLNPNGPQTMSGSIEGLVESSTNIGVIETKDNYVFMQNEVRSSVGTLKHEIRERFRALAEMTGCEFELKSDYPQWEYKHDSLIRKIFIDTYKEMTGVEPRITAIHAGLECGVLSGKLEGLDCISLGSNQYDVHTPKEHFSISSSDRVYTFLVKALANLK